VDLVIVEYFKKTSSECLVPGSQCVISGKVKPLIAEGLLFKF